MFCGNFLFDSFLLLKQGKNIGILSEAGCAGIADPGQILVAAAQELGAIVKPYTGPSSLLLALMGSGMNGQNFHFHGYLPIDALERKKKKQVIIRTSRTQCFVACLYVHGCLQVFSVHT